MARWAAIVGRGRDGKVASVKSVARALRQAGVRVGGFTSVRLGERFELEDVDTGERIPSADLSDEPDVCDLAFDSEVFQTARNWTERPGYDVVFLEVGKVEASQKGHWDTVDAAMATDRMLVLTLRPDYLVRVALRLDDPVDVVELPAEASELAAFAENLARLVRA